MEKLRFKITYQGSLELEEYLNGMAEQLWDLVHLQIIGTANNTWAVVHSKRSEDGK